MRLRRTILFLVKLSPPATTDYWKIAKDCVKELFETRQYEQRKSTIYDQLTITVPRIYYRKINKGHVVQALQISHARPTPKRRYAEDQSAL